MANNQNLGQFLREKTANKGMKYNNPIQTHLLNPNSRKLAINAHCFNCCGGSNSDDNKGVKSEIKHCAVVDCALWNFRPYQNEKARKVSTLARALDSSSETNEVINHE